MLRTLALGLSLAFLEALLLGFQHFNQGYGRHRAIMVIGLGIGLLLLPAIWRFIERFLPSETRALNIAVALLIVAPFALFDGYRAVNAIAETARTQVVRIDQGQHTYRAAEALLQGISPYGRGVIIDPTTYNQRAGQRAAAGVGSDIIAPRAMAPRATSLSEPEPGSMMEKFWRTLNPGLRVAVPEPGSVFEGYWRTFDSGLRDRLLPEPSPGNDIAEREYSLLGYKYGPVVLLIVTSLVPVLGPLAVPVTNIAACLGLLCVVALILRRTGASMVVTVLAVGAIAADYQFQWNYITLTSADIWALLFGCCALLALLVKAPIMLGVAISLAVGCKFFPGLLYVPLLFCLFRWRSVIAFAAGMAVIFLPWLIWDPMGLYFNFIAFSAYRPPDSTSWIAFANPQIASLARYALAALLAAVTIIVAMQKTMARIPLLMAFMSMIVVLAATQFHNNYVPWFSIFIVLAVVDSWQRTLGRNADPAPVSNLRSRY